MYMFLISETANTLLSLIVGIIIGATVVAIHFGKKAFEKKESPKAKIIDIDQSITESIRYEWREERPEQAN